MELPKAEEGKYIITIQCKMGILLNADGTYYIGESEDYYQKIENKRTSFYISREIN